MGIFAGGVLFGTTGVKILSSKDAKKVYTNCTAAALRAKDCIMKTATTVQENAEDILAEAQQINDERAAKEAACVKAVSYTHLDVYKRQDGGHHEQEGTGHCKTESKWLQDNEAETHVNRYHPGK